MQKKMSSSSRILDVISGSAPTLARETLSAAWQPERARSASAQQIPSHRDPHHEMLLTPVCYQHAGAPRLGPKLVLFACVLFARHMHTEGHVHAHVHMHVE